MTPAQAKIDRFRFPEQEAYWQAALLGDLPHFNLGDHPRSPVQSFIRKRDSRNLDAKLIGKLDDFTARQGVGFCIVLLAVFDALMLRYTGQEDILTVTLLPDAVREKQGSAAYFTNPVALRTQLSADTSVEECLRRVASTVESAAANRDYPFDKVIKLAGSKRDVSRSALFQVMCIFRDIPLCGGTLPVEKSDLENAEEYTARCDLVVVFYRSENGLRIDCEFDAEVFEYPTITRLLNHFQNLLEGFLAYPEHQLSTLPLLGETERHRLLVDWNTTERDYPSTKCIHELFEAQVERSPEAQAAIFEGEHLTYRELNNRSNRLASYLRKLGVGAETRVGICLHRSLEVPIVLLAILKAGGAYLPLDPAYPEERLAFMLDDAQVSLVLTHDSSMKIPAQHGRCIVCLDEIQKTVLHEDSGNLGTVIGPSNLAYVIYTSGSTGKPKGVQVQHGSVVNFLNSMGQKPGVAMEDILLSVTTLSFDIAGLEIYLPLVVGATVALVSREVATDGVELLRRLERHRATVMQSTPATWRLLLEAGWKGGKPLRVFCGGEMLPRELASRLLDKGSSIWNLYGPTETTIWSLTHQVVSGTGPIPIGRPIDNTQVFILDAHFEPVPIGVAGELYIGGVGVARGYLNRPELTAEKFVPNAFSSERGARLYRTGDSARYREDGTLECLGRIDHQIKIRGFRIELGEIEAALRQHPSVEESVVVALEASAGDKRLAAYVVLGQGESVTKGELREFLKQKLPDYMVPSAFEVLDFLPLNSSGKVDRKALPDVKACLEPDGRYVPPQDELEEALVKIWQEVLKAEKVGAQDNFFDLGGHSLLMMHVNRQLKEVIGRSLPLVQLFRYPTVRMLAQSLNPSLDLQAPPEPGGGRGQARRESIMRRQKPRERIRFTRSYQGV